MYLFAPAQRIALPAGARVLELRLFCIIFVASYMRGLSIARNTFCRAM